MKVNIFDSHLHSDNSPDGRHSVAYYCDCAIRERVMGFAVTDHFECHEDVAEQEQAILRMTFEVERARACFGKEVRLCKGIELGQPQNYQSQASDILQAIDFDVVLGSTHALPDGTDFYVANYNDPEVVVSDLLEQYFREELKLVQWNGFDVLAHLRYPERYIWGKARIPVNIALYSDYIDKILRLLIENGKALEVNTSAMKLGMQCDPGIGILKRYRELGGELITLGSDAHQTSHMAYGFDDTMDMLLTIGYRYFAFYSCRKPVMLRIL